MQNTAKHLGYLTVLDAYALLQAGITLYVVSAPADTAILPLDGGWKDDNGRIHLDCSAVILNPDTAHRIGKEYEQECIMRITPCHNGDYEVYLLKDSEFTRQIALSYCGGYTADGDYLLTAVSADKSPFMESYEDWLPAEVEFIPVKG